LKAGPNLKHQAGMPIQQLMSDPENLDMSVREVFQLMLGVIAGAKRRRVFLRPIERYR